MAFRAIIGIFLLAVSFAASADEIVLNPSHPDRYTVVKGDTLWDISSKFLRDAWRWPEIWQRNPQIKNPDLIFPGDIISLTYVNGQPRLQLQRGAKGKAFEKLSPSIRSRSIEEAIPVIPIDAIQQFLAKPKIVSQNKLNNAPYIVDFVGEHIIGGAGNGIYVRAIEAGTTDSFTVFRPGDVYKDPETSEVLGYEALYVADTKLERTGDPAKLMLTKTKMATIIGDRLLANTGETIPFNYIPRSPKNPISGHIISVMGGVSQIGQYNVVVLDRGLEDGVKTGHVFEIYQTGQIIRDIVSNRPGETVKLPNEKTGQLMVFRTFDRVSYALVVNATTALHVLDTIQTP